MGGEGGEAALLEKLSESPYNSSEEHIVKRTGTVWTAMAHIITAVIGSGVLSLAWSVAQLGWVGGPAAMVFFAGVIMIQSSLLADCYISHDPEHGVVRNRSYVDAVRLYLGEKSQLFCGFFLNFSLFGCGVVYTLTSVTSMRYQLLAIVLSIFGERLTPTLVAGHRLFCLIDPRLLRAIEWERKKVREKDPSLRQDRLPREVYDRDSTSGKTKLTLPSFAGNYDPDAYLTWELVVQQLFACHEFPDHLKVRAVTREFTDFASIWWSEYCRTNQNIPRTWNALKRAMRHRFVPSYYSRELLNKLQRLRQGSSSVEDYYQDLQTALSRCGLEETEDAKITRFLGGLNHQIWDKLVYKPPTVTRLFRLACKVEKEVQGRQSKTGRALSSTSTTPSRVHETNKRTVHTSASRSSSVASSAAASTMIAAPAAVSVTLSRCLAPLARSLLIDLEQEEEGKACDYSPPPVPTSPESSLQEKETEIGRLQDKDRERSLLFDETARIARENAEEIRIWERLYNEAVASHKEEVEKLDSRLSEQAVENKRLLEASTCNQKEMQSTKINLQDNIALLNNVLSELHTEGKTPQDDTIAAHTSTIGQQVGILRELVTTLRANQAESIREAVEGAVSYALAKLKAHDPNLNLQPIEVDFICPEAEASQLIEEMQSIGKKVSEEMQLGSPSSE